MRWISENHTADDLLNMRKKHPESPSYQLSMRNKHKRPIDKFWSDNDAAESFRSKTSYDELDAYGIASQHTKTSTTTKHNRTTTKDDPSKYSSFWKHAQELLDDFQFVYARRPMYDAGYGTTKLDHQGTQHETMIARAITKRALLDTTSNTGNNNNTVTWRLAQAITLSDTISIVCIGSAAMAGVGNYNGQAYSHVLERSLQPLVHALDKTIHVSHVAFSDVSEFPLLWCLNDMIQEDSANLVLPNVIIWDFEDDAEESADKLESFVRNTWTLWSNHGMTTPIVFFRNLPKRHLPIIDYYQEYLNAVVIYHRFAARPFMSIPETARPVGFQKWNDFGVPIRSSSHPTLHLLSVQQHTFVGMVLSMQFLAALELAVLGEMGNSEIRHKLDSSSSHSNRTGPLPLSIHLQGIASHSSWRSLVLGNYHPESLSCYTSYDLNARISSDESRMIDLDPRHTYMPSNLQSLIVSQALGTEQELLLPKMPLYQQSWVLDLDETSTRDKMLTKHSDFLGHNDWKKAYYGVPQSGHLELFVPLLVADDRSNAPVTVNSYANDLVRTLLLCESDAPTYSSDACSISADVRVLVNGQAATLQAVNTDVVSTFGKRTCAHVVLPPVTTLFSPGRRDALSSQSLGLSLSVSVENKRISLQSGPCSIAHVILLRK